MKHFSISLRLEKEGFKVAVYRKLWFWIAVLAFLSPLGLLSQGTAWGEWGIDELEKLLGMVPQGLARFGESWPAVLPDYSIPGLDRGFAQQAVGYIFCALVGIAAVVFSSYAIGRILMKGNDR